MCFSAKRFPRKISVLGQFLKVLRELVSVSMKWMRLKWNQELLP